MQKLWDDAADAYRRKLLHALPRGPGQRLLDLGCDDGEWTEHVRRRMGIRPEDVIGLEAIPQRAELAAAHGFDIRVTDLDESWPVTESSIDVVHANQVIEHVARLDHFVQETKRVLKPGGTAVVCTENLASWHNIGALLLGWQPFSTTNISGLRPIGNPLALHAGEPPSTGETWQHTHVMALRGLLDLFTAHGFETTETFAAGYYPACGRVARLLERVDPRHAHFIGLAARTRR
jgi:SAM-dependent methyltransferase